MFDSKDLEPGYYWVRFCADSVDWEPAHWDGGYWYVCGMEERWGDVTEVGERLTHGVRARKAARRRAR